MIKRLSILFFLALCGTLFLLAPHHAKANTYYCPDFPPGGTFAGITGPVVTCTGPDGCDCVCPTPFGTITCPPYVPFGCDPSGCWCDPNIPPIPSCTPPPPPPPPPPPAGDLCNPYGESFVPTGLVNVYPDDGPGCQVSGPPGTYSYPPPRPPNKVLKQKPGCDPAQCSCTDACPPGMPPPPTPVTCSTEPGPDCCSYYEYNCNEGGDCGDCAYANNPYIMTDSSPVRCNPVSGERECATYCVTCESPCMQECEAKVCSSLDADTYQACIQGSHAAAADCISKCPPNWCRFLGEEPCCAPEAFDPYTVCMGSSYGSSTSSSSSTSSGTSGSSGTTPTP